MNSSCEKFVSDKSPAGCNKHGAREVNIHKVIDRPAAKMVMYQANPDAKGKTNTMSTKPEPQKMCNP